MNRHPSCRRGATRTAAPLLGVEHGETRDETCSRGDSKPLHVQLPPVRDGNGSCPSSRANSRRTEDCGARTRCPAAHNRVMTLQSLAAATHGRVLRRHGVQFPATRRELRDLSRQSAGDERGRRGGGCHGPDVESHRVRPCLRSSPDRPASARGGEKHPYETDTATVARYFEMTGDCAEVQRLVTQ
jgi:hypothetical protein